uniref:Uncharacterized protein n=1 Tax=Litopenaeus vannamei majanivirus Nimav-1_LVa TaxID=2984273 RepID=A0A9C7EY83_9VIRU|nr:MAG: hypothetical protein [Litopenaeus vannamei majanivirus Nimav-1_LVa]
MKKGDKRKYKRRWKQIVSSSLQTDILEHGIKQITSPQNGFKFKKNMEQKWLTDTDQDNEHVPPFEPLQQEDIQVIQQQTPITQTTCILQQEEAQQQYGDIRGSYGNDVPSQQQLSFIAKQDVSSTEQTTDSLQHHGPPTPQTTCILQQEEAQQQYGDIRGSYRNDDGIQILHIPSQQQQQLSFIAKQDVSSTEQTTDSLQHHGPPTPQTTCILQQEEAQQQYGDIRGSYRNDDDFQILHIPSQQQQLSFIAKQDVSSTEQTTDSSQHHGPPTTQTTCILQQEEAQQQYGDIRGSYRNDDGIQILHIPSQQQLSFIAKQDVSSIEQTTDSSQHHGPPTTQTTGVLQQEEAQQQYGDIRGSYRNDDGIQILHIPSQQQLSFIAKQDVSSTEQTTDSLQHHGPPTPQTTCILQQEEAQQQYGDIRGSYRNDDGIQILHIPSQQQQLSFIAKQDVSSTEQTTDSLQHHGPLQQCSDSQDLNMTDKSMQQDEIQTLIKSKQNIMNKILCNQKIWEKIILLAFQKKMNNILEDSKDENYIYISFKDKFNKNKHYVSVAMESTSLDENKEKTIPESIHRFLEENKLNTNERLNTYLCGQVYTVKYMMVEIINLIGRVVYLRKYGSYITIVVKFLKNNEDFFVYNMSTRDEKQQTEYPIKQDTYNILYKMNYINITNSQ